MTGKHENTDEEEESQTFDVSVHEKTTPQSEKRDLWGSQIESVLSLVGYTVGLGNIWRFPYICYRNGGGVFMFPFLLFLVICGGPLYYMELCLGQFSGKSIINVWCFCPLFKGVGFIAIIVSFIYMWYFGVIIAWVFYYLFNCFHSTLPWTTCSNNWNTAFCIDASTNISDTQLSPRINASDLIMNVTFNSAGTEFWERHVLHKSDSIEEFGYLEPKLAGCLFLGWLVVFVCLFKGVQSLGKVVYVTATLPFVLLTILVIRGCTLDGAWEGLRYYFIPDLGRLKTKQIWIEAAIQCFFSLGAAWGPVISMASFNKFNGNIFRTTMIVCIADTFTGFYGGVVVFSVLGFLAKETGIPLDQMSITGPGLAFVAYPEALSRLPVPNVWSALFFLTLIMLGLDTQFGHYETICMAIIDANIERFSKHKRIISVSLAIILSLTGLVLLTSAGIYIFILVDYYYAAFGIVLSALVECIAVSWIYGANRFCSDVAMMTGSSPTLLLRMCWCFVMPLFMLGILITTAITISSPNLGSGSETYVYPTTALVFGYIIAFGPIILALAIALYDIHKQNGPIPKRIVRLLRPTKHWSPNDDKLKTNYLLENGVELELFNRFRADIVGIRPNHH